MKVYEPDPNTHKYGCLYVICTILTFIIALAMMLLMSCAFASCTTVKYVDRDHVVTKTDTIFHERLLRDSLFLHDSIYIHEWMKNDTVRIERERWHTQYRDRWLHDTAYIAKHDTIRIEKTITKQAKVSVWKQAEMWLGRIVAVLLLVCIIATILQRIFVKRKL